MSGFIDKIKYSLGKDKKNTEKPEDIKMSEHNDKNKKQIIELQKKFKNGEIKQEELSNEDIDNLISLYDEQIEKIKIEIEEKRLKIENMKNNKK